MSLLRLEDIYEKQAEHPKRGIYRLNFFCCFLASSALIGTQSINIWIPAINFREYGGFDSTKENGSLARTKRTDIERQTRVCEGIGKWWSARGSKDGVG